jgi:hypothetical protein
MVSICRMFKIKAYSRKNDQWLNRKPLKLESIFEAFRMPYFKGQSILSMKSLEKVRAGGPNLGLKLTDFLIFWVFFHSFCQKFAQNVNIFP